jgi:hypothetical protein
VFTPVRDRAVAASGRYSGMSAAAHNRVASRGPGLLIAYFSALDHEDRLPATDRLHRLIGPDLTRLLLVALAGDHRMGSRLAAG